MTPAHQMIELPRPQFQGMPLEKALRGRRSVREFSNTALTQEQLSQLLFAAHGITATVNGRAFFTAPSAGGTNPFEIYVLIQNVKGLGPGIYRYEPLKNALEIVALGDFRERIIASGRGQKWTDQAPAAFVLTAVFERTTEKYGERGLRYIDMEAGHICQNIHLQAVSLNLGSLSVGAFDEERLNELLGIDGKTQSVIYLCPVGVPQL